jgi:hypothetical protein
VELELAETAERLRKPESGTGAGMEQPVPHRGWREDAVVGQRNLRGGRIRPTGRTVEKEGEGL